MRRTDAYRSPTDVRKGDFEFVSLFHSEFWTSTAGTLHMLAGVSPRKTTTNAAPPISARTRAISSAPGPDHTTSLSRILPFSTGAATVANTRTRIILMSLLSAFFEDHRKFYFRLKIYFSFNRKVEKES